MTDTLEIVNQNSAAPAGVPAVKGENTPAVARANAEFEGLGNSVFAKRVVLDGTQILYKDTGVAHDRIVVRLEGGREVHQFFDEENNTYIKSYDGKFTEAGDPVSNYPGMRRMFELDWHEIVDDSPAKHQLVLAPTGRYEFLAYAEKLLKIGKKLTEVETIITCVRAESKDKQRYSKPQFTCQELIEQAKAAAGK